jgi:hypothetical protein
MKTRTVIEYAPPFAGPLERRRAAALEGLEGMTPYAG